MMKRMAALRAGVGAGAALEAGVESGRSEVGIWFLSGR
jgi:hypothetical protein